MPYWITFCFSEAETLFYGSKFLLNGHKLLKKGTKVMREHFTEQIKCVFDDI